MLVEVAMIMLPEVMVIVMVMIMVTVGGDDIIGDGDGWHW